jgi:hypothetical protein
MTQRRMQASALLTGRAMKSAVGPLFIVALAGCGGQSEQDWRSASSWTLTAIVVARYWESGDLPDTYARRALKKVADELGKGPLPQAAEPVDELRQALERGDREAVRRLAQELSGR